MRTIAVLPIKTFAAAKQRLGGMLAGGSREALAQAMFSDVLASLRKVEGLHAVAVVTASRAAQAAAQGEGVIVLHDAAQSGQSAAALAGIRYATTRGFDRVLLVPGDVPLLDATEVDALLERTARDPLCLVPDREGVGTNAILMSPPSLIEPSFGPGSFERHLAAGRAAGVEARVEQVACLLHDIDTPQDLDDLTALLAQRRGLASRTRGALRQLERSEARGPQAVRRADTPDSAARA